MGAPQATRVAGSGCPAVRGRGARAQNIIHQNDKKPESLPWSTSAHAAVCTPKMLMPQGLPRELVKRFHGEMPQGTLCSQAEADDPSASPDLTAHCRGCSHAHYRPPPFLPRRPRDHRETRKRPSTPTLPHPSSSSKLRRAPPPPQTAALHGSNRGGKPMPSLGRRPSPATLPRRPRVSSAMCDNRARRGALAPPRDGATRLLRPTARHFSRILSGEELHWQMRFHAPSPARQIFNFGWFRGKLHPRVNHGALR